MRTFSHLVLVLSLLVAIVVSGCSKEKAAEPAASVDTAPATAAPPPASAATATEPAAAPQPATKNAIASADGEKSGVRLDVTELKRGSGGTVNLKFVIVNDSAERFGFGYDFVEKGSDYGDIGGVHLLDPEGKKKYFVARDTEGNCVCSRNLKDLEKGSSINLWAKFPAPPPEVKKISVVVPHFSPLDDLPISD
jgi:hypothetical protein